MIVVVGVPGWNPDLEAPGGLAAQVALAAAAGGARVQLVGRVGDDDLGDRLVLALARGNVGHVALLRDPARPTPVVAQSEDESPVAEPVAASAARDTPPASAPELDAPDVDLGLSYLDGTRVIVLEPGLHRDVVASARAAAERDDAQLIVLRRTGDPDEPALGTATQLEAPGQDGEVPFARLVARYAVSLDEGQSPREAFSAAVAATGWGATG